MFKPSLKPRSLAPLIYALRRTVLVQAMLALAGCASVPDYTAPALPASATGHFVSTPEQTDPAAAPPAQWWKLYDDRALDDLVSAALSANTDIRVALANLQQAQAIYQQVRSDLLPATAVSAGVNYGRDQPSWSGPGQAPTQWSYSGGLAVSYELDLFGRVAHAINAAQADADAMTAAYHAAQVMVAAETTRAYVDSCNYGAALAVAQWSVDLTRQRLAIARNQQQAGAVADQDVERAQATLSQDLSVAPPLQARRSAALFELAALMGRTPAQVPASAQSCSSAPRLSAALPVGDGAALLRRRPDVQQAERQLAGETARVGVATADLYPTITLGSSVSYLRNDTLRGDRTLSFSVGPLISWTFPDQAAARSRITQAQARTAASLARFDGSVLTALKESEQSLSAYASALSARAELAEAREHAQRNLDLIDLRYRAGSASYLDVLSAKSNVADASLQLADADQRLGSVRVDVFKALGGGWSF